jgi:ABC-type bacteriocin/lantibiotic exporter with double-glycine peptidase domain
MTICIILYYIPNLGFIFAISIIGSIFLQKYILNLLNSQWIKYWEEYIKFNKLYQDIMLNIWNVKYNTIELLVNRLLKTQFNKRLKTLKKWWNYKIIAYEGPDFIYFIIIIALLFKLVEKTEIELSIKIFMILQIFRLWKEYHNICLSTTNIYQNMKYVQKICPIWIYQTANSDNLKNIKSINSIRFSNVFYNYSPDVPVLKNINFEIKSGETLSLSGSSGSGKSTIINLICRLYDISDPSSKIEINNNNINEYNIDSIRQCISIVPQNIMVFDMTVKENIILDSPYDKEKVINLMKMVNLTDLDKNANEMSLGQKQRVIIARTLYQDKSVYIFDEYLSAIDKPNADRIHKFVLNYLKNNNKIGIFISHNPKHVETTDKVVKL